MFSTPPLPPRASGFYGYDRLYDAIRTAPLDAGAIIDELQEDVLEFSDSNLSEDICAIAIQRLE